MKKFLKRLGQGLAATVVSAGGLFTLGVWWPLETPVPQPVEPRLVITNVNVVDVETGQVSAGNILIEAGEIVAVGDDMATDGARILDGKGSYAIPGLFDMHTHAYKMAPALTHPLNIASGVTAVRDMGGCMDQADAWVACVDDKRRWNAMAVTGELVSPRFDHVTSLAINGGPEIPAGVDESLGAATAAGALARVAYDRARGTDFLKTYTGLTRTGYFTLAEEAPKAGLYLAGHLPFSVSVTEAVAAGQRSFEHAFLFIWGCYPGMKALREAGDVSAAFTNEARASMIAGHDEATCATVRQEMAAAGTAYVPTHTTRKLDAFALDQAFRTDARLKYIPAPLRMLWLDDADGMARRAGAGGEESYKAIYDFGIRQTGLAHAAGVPVLLGTDAPDSFAFPGLGVHDEFGHFIRAGLTPLDALRTATLAPAKFLGLEGRAGVIKPGARADIVLLGANPLDDIAAVREVQAVILAGGVYDRQKLDGMLRAVEENANSWSMWPKFAWQIARSPVMLRQFAD